jgi:hypothetical protein
VYGTAAVGVLGIADFAVAGALGLAKKHAVESTNCAPFCSAGEVNDIRTHYAIADVGLAVGVAGIFTAGILFLTRPVRTAPTRAGSLLFEPTPLGGVVGWRRPF